MKKLLSLLLALGLACAPCAFAAPGQPAPAPAAKSAPATKPAPAKPAAPATTAAKPAPAAKAAPAAAQKVGAGYHGNPSSKVYHNSSCRHYNSKGASKVFASPAEAKAAGYKPCKICKG